MIVRAGSLAKLKTLQTNKVLDIVMVHRKTFCERYLIRKELSKSKKTAMYYNRFWRLGLLDHELSSYAKIVDGKYVIQADLEVKLKLSRTQSLRQNLKCIKINKGMMRAIFILFLFVANSTFNWIKSNDR